MSLSRRKVLAMIALAPIGACKTLTDENLQRIIDDVTTIADGVAAALPAISTVSGLAGGARATVDAVVADVKRVSVAISSVVSTTAAQPIVTRLESGIASALSALAGAKLPALVSTVLKDASILLPFVKTAVGLFVPMAPAGEGEIVEARLRLKAAARQAL